MTTLNIGGIGFVQKYDNLKDAFAASEPNDTILINNNITINETVEIDHDINIEANDDSVKITVADEVTAIEVVKGALQLKNLVVYTNNQSVFIHKQSTDKAKITLTNTILVNYDSNQATNCFPSILIKNDADQLSTKLTLNDSITDFIEVMVLELSINGGRVGNILNPLSKIHSKIVTGGNLNLTNVRILANYCSFLNLHSIGNLMVTSDLKLNGFTVDPLPLHQEPRLRDNDFINYQKAMDCFEQKRDIVALKIGSDSRILKVSIQNANLNQEVLAAQIQVLNVASWFFMFNCDASIDHSLISNTAKQNVSSHSSLAITYVNDDDTHVTDNWSIQDPQY